MSEALTGLACGALLAIALSGHARAENQYGDPDWEARTVDTGAVGGEGGGPFRVLCPVGAYLAGFEARSGAWIDAIGPACRAWDEQRRIFRADDVQTVAMVGGSTGGQTAMRCRRNAALSGIGGGRGANEDRSLAVLQFNCRRIDNPSQSRQQQESGPIRFGQFHKKGGLKLGFDEVECPPGHWAVGIFGRSGVYVDALGLVCAPGPEKRPSPQPPAPPKPRPFSGSSTLDPDARPRVLDNAKSFGGSVPSETRRIGPSDSRASRLAPPCPDGSRRKQSTSGEWVCPK